MKQVVVWKRRVNVLLVNFGYDISLDTFESEIKTSSGGTLLATWTCTFENDGIDGVLRLEMDDIETTGIERDNGEMDIKRISGGKSYVVHDDPIQVIFKNPITS